MRDAENDRSPAQQTLTSHYFTDGRTDVTADSELVPAQSKQYLFESSKILPYLQTVFFEEHFIEVQIDYVSRLFFASLLDDIPPADHATTSLQTNVEEDHEPGAYLKKAESILLTPLTPGVGNAHARSSKRIILRYYTGTMVVEFGCRFQQQHFLQDVPVLRFAFPELCRISRIARPYRVKTISGVDAYVTLPSITGDERYAIADISATGMAFQAFSNKAILRSGTNVKLSIKVQDINNLEINGIVRRIASLRNQFGYAIVYGVQFDLESRALAAEIEQTVAAIQRLHLRELAEKTSDLRGVRIMR